MYNLQVLFAAILPFIWSMPVSAAPGLVARDQTGTFKTTTQTPSGNQKPSPNTQAAHVLTLEQRSGTATSAGYAQSLRQNTQVNGVYGTSDVSSVEGGTLPHYHLSYVCRRLLTRNSRLGLCDRDRSWHRELHSRCRHRQ